VQLGRVQPVTRWCLKLRVLPAVPDAQLIQLRSGCTVWVSLALHSLAHLSSCLGWYVVVCCCVCTECWIDQAGQHLCSGCVWAGGIGPWGGWLTRSAKLAHRLTEDCIFPCWDCTQAYRHFSVFALCS
jgi:hypothetical protein